MSGLEFLYHFRSEFFGFFEARDYAAAERAFREVITLDPRSAAAYSDLGVFYLRTNRITSAIQSFEAAQKLAPKEIGIDLNLDLAYYRQRDFEHAIPHFNRVLAADPGNYQARYLAERLSGKLPEGEGSTP